MSASAQLTTAQADQLQKSGAPLRADGAGLFYELGFGIRGTLPPGWLPSSKVLISSSQADALEAGGAPVLTDMYGVFLMTTNGIHAYPPKTWFPKAGPKTYSLASPSPSYSAVKSSATPTSSPTTVDILPPLASRRIGPAPADLEVTGIMKTTTAPPAPATPKPSGFNPMMVAAFLAGAYIWSQYK